MPRLVRREFHTPALCAEIKRMKVAYSSLMRTIYSNALRQRYGLQRDYRRQKAGTHRITIV